MFSTFQAKHRKKWEKRRPASWARNRLKRKIATLPSSLARTTKVYHTATITVVLVKKALLLDYLFI
jgi:hypothetical protein